MGGRGGRECSSSLRGNRRVQAFGAAAWRQTAVLYDARRRLLRQPIAIELSLDGTLAERRARPTTSLAPASLTANTECAER